ncbi:MAG TPA: amidohydrolase, partial [Aestuariivirgaceae bacterium]|nr:amidohydrolase [Aestuariivirgaceae bacterium]
DGTVHLIFQPAEEDIGGARRMMDDGLFTRFPCDAVFALHNLPGLDVGRYLFREGPIMAAVDIARIGVKGRGGHGALPHLTADPVVAAASLVVALQTIVSRNVDPVEAAVVSVGIMRAGDFPTVIPSAASLDVAIRSCSATTRDLLQQRILELAPLQARSFGCIADVDYERGYPVTVNDPEQTRFARSVAVDQAGAERVADLAKPMMISEDFAFMLEDRPGCYFFVGNGPSASLHDGGYDFNDAAIVPGVRYWMALIERYFAT